VGLTLPSPAEKPAREAEIVCRRRAWLEAFERELHRSWLIREDTGRREPAQDRPAIASSYRAGEQAVAAREPCLGAEDGEAGSRARAERIALEPTSVQAPPANRDAPGIGAVSPGAPGRSSLSLPLEVRQPGVDCGVAAALATPVPPENDALALAIVSWAEKIGALEDVVPDLRAESGPRVSAPAEGRDPLLRWHFEWTDGGVRAWLGLDASLSLPLATLLEGIRRGAASRGLRLLSFVCNGKTVFETPPTYNNGDTP
jgi:hypothetical protein